MSSSVTLQTEAILRIVSALRMHHRKAQYIPLRQFYTIANKLQLANMASGVDEKALEDLSEAEKLAYQLVTALPSTYGLKQSNIGGKNIWCLEQNTGERDGVSELQNVKSATPDPSQQSKIIEILREAREELCLKAPTKKRPREEVQKATITSDMTIDERVAARHAANTERREKSTDAMGASKISDKQWLVRVADILWSHSKQATLPYLFSLKEAVDMACKNHHRNNISRRKAVDYIVELNRVAPEWIKLEKDEKSDKLTPNTTVWILKVPYGRIRARLQGKPYIEKAKPAGVDRNIARFRSPVPNVRRAPVVTNSAKTAKPLAGRSLKAKTK